MTGGLGTGEGEGEGEGDTSKCTSGLVLQVRNGNSKCQSKIAGVERDFGVTHLS